MIVWSCCSVCLQEAAAGLVFPLASYSKTALLWQHRTGRAQHGLPLALDQADLGPDITSIAAASPLLALCCTVQLTMPCLSAVVSSMQGRGNANLTERWLTTAATVANRLIFMCYCFQCPTSQRDLTALLTSYLRSGGDVYVAQQLNSMPVCQGGPTLCKIILLLFLNVHLLNWRLFPWHLVWNVILSK